jgi:hypothetical protein
VCDIFTGNRQLSEEEKEQLYDNYGLEIFNF